MFKSMCDIEAVEITCTRNINFIDKYRIDTTVIKDLGKAGWGYFKCNRIDRLKGYFKDTGRSWVV